MEIDTGAPLSAPFQVYISTSQLPGLAMHCMGERGTRHITAAQAMTPYGSGSQPETQRTILNVTILFKTILNSSKTKAQKKKRN